MRPPAFTGWLGAPQNGRVANTGEFPKAQADATQRRGVADQIVAVPQLRFALNFVEEVALSYGRGSWQHRFVSVAIGDAIAAVNETLDGNYRAALIKSVEFFTRKYSAILRIDKLGVDEVVRGTPGRAFPKRPLPRDRHGNPVPESDAPHTQLGKQEGRRGSYPQAREFDAQGRPVRDIDFTDHGRGHPTPHQHRYIPNPTGGTPQRGPYEPLGDP